MTPELKANLTAAARISEISLRWTMNQLFFVIHSGLFVLAVTQFKLGLLPHIGVALLGLWLTGIWLFATRRAQHLVQDWNEKMAALELAQAQEEASERRSVRIFITEEGRVPSPPGIPIHALLIVLVITFLVVWAFLLALSVYRYFRP